MPALQQLGEKYPLVAEIQNKPQSQLRNVVA